MKTVSLDELVKAQTTWGRSGNLHRKDHGPSALVLSTVTEQAWCPLKPFPSCPQYLYFLACQRGDVSSLTSLVPCWCSCLLVHRGQRCWRSLHLRCLCRAPLSLWLVSDCIVDWNAFLESSHWDTGIFIIAVSGPWLIQNHRVAHVRRVQPQTDTAFWCTSLCDIQCRGGIWTGAVCSIRFLNTHALCHVSLGSPAGRC